MSKYSGDGPVTGGGDGGSGSRKRKKSTRTDESQAELDDYYNINLQWSTLDPRTSHKIAEFLFHDHMAIKCQEQIISHLTTNDITVWTGDNTRVQMDPDYDHEFQLYYKAFVKDACVANWVYGVVPVVLKPTKTGNYVPKVPELGTYILQVAYIAETEEHVFRTIRPQKYCARPQDLVERDKYHMQSNDTQFSQAAEKLMSMLNMNKGTGGLNLDVNPDAYTNNIFTGKSPGGFYIDRTMSVFDIFGSKPGPLGEIRSPLVGMITQVSIAGHALDFQQAAQYNMIHPMILVQPEKEQNIDGGQTSFGDDPSDPRNHQSLYGSSSGGRRCALGETEYGMSRSMNDHGAPLPPISSMSPANQAQARRTIFESYSNSQGGVVGGFGGSGGEYGRGYTGEAARRQAGREYVGYVNNEMDKRFRYCPKGFSFSSSYKTPDVPSYYQEARRNLDEATCGAFNVPIGMMNTREQGAGTRDTFQGFLYMFQRSVTDRATKIQRFLTIFLRESLCAPSLGTRFLNMKPMAPNFAKIDEENARVGDAGGFQSQTSTLFDMTGGEVPEYRGTMEEVPVNNPAGIMRAEKKNGGSSEGNGGIWTKGEEGSGGKGRSGGDAGVSYAKALADEANEGRQEKIYERHHDPSRERDLNEDVEKLIEERTADGGEKGKEGKREAGSGDEGEDEDEAKYKGLNFKSRPKKRRKIHADVNGERHGHRRRGNGSDPDDESKVTGKGASSKDSWISRVQVRLSPLVYSQSLDIASQLVNSGAYSPEAYQTALCQIGGIPDPANPTGLPGARKNQEYWYVVSGEKAKEDAKIREEERAHKRDIEMTKLKAKLSKEQAMAIAAMKPAPGTSGSGSGSSSGSSSSSSSSGSKSSSSSSSSSKTTSGSSNSSSKSKSSSDPLKSSAGGSTASGSGVNPGKSSTGAKNDGKKDLHLTGQSKKEDADGKPGGSQ